MSEKEHITDPSAESPTPHPFREAVLTAQNEWRRLYEDPQWRNAMVIEPSEIDSLKLLEMTVDNLPNYISDEIRQGLLDSHPAPFFNLTPGYDKRILAPPPSNLEHFVFIPKEIGESERTKEQWLQGMSALGEIGNFFTVADMSSDLESYGKYIPAFLLWGYNGMASRLRRAKNIAEESINFGDYFEFKKSIVEARLTGNFDTLNDLLGRSGLTVDSLATKIGSIDSTHSLQKENSTEKGKSTKIQTHVGMYIGGYPGVISLPLKLTIPFALIGATYHTVTHEVLHYLAQDTQHMELYNTKLCITPGVR